MSRRRQSRTVDVVGWNAMKRNHQDGVTPGSRDLNGRVVQPGRWARLRSRFGGAGPVAPLSVDDADLVVVAGSDDDAVASSTALAESSWRPDDEVVLRHILRLPVHRSAEAVSIAALDGYVRVEQGGGSISGDDGHALVVLARVQQLDAMHLSQERSRMASLGSRHGGVALCWHVLQRPPT
ncbi:hypothetical protein [Gordonia sp. ABSL49_1]|uniref:hypothetical protein n=1 Tax=unclassified Gordonia (in: high G+C Gram-positive bacteria) TaxID=2657482 RepID=UPI0027E36114|nr:hypothetical protein [Gordonia sp. ABSL49_1]